MTRRLVVIGADAAGMSAASQALRVAAHLGRDLEVIAFESTEHTSYSQCGIPYWVAGDVDGADALVARTAEQHRANGIDLRLGSAVTSIDLDAGHVVVDGGSGEQRVGFDELMIGTGAEPILPDWAREVPSVLAMKTMDDGAAWRRLLAATDGQAPESVLVVGGGFIGVEAAESFAKRGVRTTLVTRSSEPMAHSLDPQMGALVRRGLEDLGVEVVTGAEVSGIESRDGLIGAACVSGVEHRADAVALAIGVRPRVGLARAAGLPLGDHGGLVPDDRQQVADGIWAAGDCCEVWDRLLESHWYTPLGTHANKAGKVAGTNIGGGTARFAGSVGTAITRAGAAEVARTGLLPAWAGERGLDAVQVTIESTTAAGYMPEADPVTVSVVGERGSGRLLGGQIVGGRGAGKRIDVLAMALWSGLTAADVVDADLAYCPPFSPTWDPVQIACRKLDTAVRDPGR
ncbi:FAD-dependent oxidoreductase [Angustibacter sp. McL0619]|uniref:FAD-dependent oxidoreductase n=1 Tax=Angustibacter sp. McL0619 TaxID=3415676 RepID=UPI003CE7F2D0